MGLAQKPSSAVYSFTYEVVLVSGQIVIEMTEDPVSVAEPDAGSRLFRNIPRQVGLVSLPGLVER